MRVLVHVRSYSSNVPFPYLFHPTGEARSFPAVLLCIDPPAPGSFLAGPGMSEAIQNS
jgi:hypothetical protein